MKTINEIIIKVKELKRDWYVIHQNYKSSGGDKFGYEKIGNKTIVLTMRERYYNKDMEKWCYYNERKINTMFNRIIRGAGVITVTSPVTNELWYDNSIEWLYYCYPYWDSNNANVVLLNSSWRILAVQYNWLNKVDYLHAKWVFNVPEYVVLNNKKKLEGKYRALDYKELEKNILLPLFNKNILCKAN